jgi:hypothetical protein
MEENLERALDGLGARDEARAAWREQQRQRTLRRRGRKGARVWGYNTGGGRRAKGRDQ